MTSSTNENKNRNEHQRQTLAALIAVIAVAAAALFGINPVGASSHTDDPAEAAASGAAWLAAQVEADGSVQGGFDPLGDAALVALALAVAGTGGDAFDRAVGHVVTNAEAFVDPTTFGDDPGRIGRGMMLAELAAIDPTDFGGVDLPSRLAASLGTYEVGLYGSLGPDFDGAFRQGLAFQGLAAIGQMPPAGAITWLQEQQCSDGTWTAYQADPDAACPPPNPDFFSGPETNAAAAAIIGLEAVGSAAPVDPIPGLRGAQNADGGFGYIIGGSSEPNSTAVVAQALLALGVDPATVDNGGPSVWDALLSFQLGCDREPGERGSFFYPLPDLPASPNLLASVDAVPAAAGAAPPLAGPIDLAPTAPAMDCSQPTTTTTSTTEAPTSTTSTTSAPTTAAAQPAALTPTFTG